MNFNKRINVLRGGIMRTLTKNVGMSQISQQLGSTQKSEIKSILICRPNHRLGNLLLITPLVKEVSETFPGAKIDLFVKGDLSPSVFKNFHNINRIIELPKKPFDQLFNYLGGWIKIKKKKYDLVINVINTSSSGRLSAQFAKAKFKFFGDIEPERLKTYPDYLHVAKYPVHSLRSYLGEPRSNGDYVSPLTIELSPSEIAEGQRILHDLVKNDKKTICLFTNATGTKLYPQDWWEELYAKLKINFPGFNIVELLPVENTSQIGFQAPAYSNKDIRIAGSFIANSAVFIGADSGMMHLASAVHAPTVGLFKVTSPDLYAPYNPGSVAIDTNTSSIDDCIENVRAVLAK